MFSAPTLKQTDRKSKATGGDDKKLKFATLEQVLGFLQSQYASFRRKRDGKQVTVRERNVRVRSTSSSSEKTLRNLYIELMLHDKALIDGEGSLSEKDMFRLIMQKVGIQGLIKDREVRGEKVVPDETVERVASECRDDERKLKNHLLQWIEESKRNEFARVLQACTGSDWITSMLKKKTSIDSENFDQYAQFICLQECLIRSVELSSQ